jgi:hypothetical protein
MSWNRLALPLDAVAKTTPEEPRAVNAAEGARPAAEHVGVGVHKSSPSLDRPEFAAAQPEHPISPIAKSCGLSSSLSGR